MRVLECNICGEPLGAATDEELLARLRSHVESRHPGESLDESEARRVVADQAYHATDS